MCSQETEASIRVFIGEREDTFLQAARYLNDIVVDVLLRELSNTTEKLKSIPACLFRHIHKRPDTDTMALLSSDYSKPCFFPVCEKYHWSLLAISHEHCTITQYDSLRTNLKRAKYFQSYLERIFHNKFTVNLKRPILQTNGH